MSLEKGRILSSKEQDQLEVEEKTTKEVKNLEEEIKKQGKDGSQGTKDKVEVVYKGDRAELVVTSQYKELRDKMDGIANNLPKNIREIAREKLKKDIKKTKEIWDKYEKINGKKPNFFPFFCAYGGYEMLKANGRTNNDILTIVDYSQGGSGYGSLHMINTRTNRIILGTKSVQGSGGHDFGNEDGSGKSSLGFCIVDKPQIDPTGSTGPHVVLNGLEPGFNDNMKKRLMYAHAGTKSEGCIVVPGNKKGDRERNRISGVGEEFLNNLIGRSTRAPVERGKYYSGQKNGVIFSYAPNADYLKNSNYV